MRALPDDDDDMTMANELFPILIFDFVDTVAFDSQAQHVFSYRMLNVRVPARKGGAKAGMYEEIETGKKQPRSPFVIGSAFL